MRAVRGIFALIVGAALLVGCGNAGSPASEQQGGATGSTAPAVVRIAAASDLKFALEEVKKEFTAANPNVDLQLTFGSSGTFRQQIANGAPFDMFLSADVKLAEALAKEGLAAPKDVFSYAVGRLVVWTPKTSPVNPATGLQSLVTPAASKVSIANPEHAPYGRAAVSAMQKAGVYDQVKGKLVLGENIAQAAEFVTSGNAPVGVIALSLALSPQLASVGRYAEVPLDSFPWLDQGGVVISRAQDPQAAQAVKAFLVGPQGVEVLKRYGFYLPGS